MLYIKDGYPQVNEIVLCTVTKIFKNTTFLKLDEYEKEGVLIISEIAPGRIRNLRDHVIENKKIVCKVLRVDQRGKRIDVSLRRVPIPVMKDKLEQIKKEEFSDKVYLDVSKQLKLLKDEFFEKTYEIIFENYELVFEALYDIMLNNSKIDMFENLTKNEKEIFLKIINDKIKPEEITFKKTFNLSCFNLEGVDLIKKAIKFAIKTLNYSKLDISYLSAGEFEIKIIHDDLKSANKIYDLFAKNLKEFSYKNNLECNFN